MYSMNFDITIGKYRLAALEKVAIKCSVENLADTADITLPGTLFNRALKVEQKIAEGDAVRIRLVSEFSPFYSQISSGILFCIRVFRHSINMFDLSE